MIYNKKIHQCFQLFLFCFLSIVTSCNQSETESERLRKQNQKGEYIYRMKNEVLFAIESPKKATQAPYPWEEGKSSQYPRLTKEYFRCKGSGLNPPHIVQPKEGEPARYYDCGGSEKHSLPLRDGKEFVYPILLDLLNYIQNKTGKRVLITSGHRCPDHNSYVDDSKENCFSKHMVGAEVSFYVQGMEQQPEAVVKCIQDYYKETPKYKGLKEYEEFKRYEKKDTNVSTPPWLNKEIFVKIYKKHEGRNFDNRHPYPYIDVQVRYDWDLKEKVIYTWDKANRNYLRK